MRTLLLSAALTVPLAGFSMPLWAQDDAPPARETPSDVIAAATAQDWRSIEPENLLVMTLGDGAQVYIELAPDFAPVHVENIRRLARAHWYDGISVNRVQDNYVVQWGDPAEEAAERKPLPEDVVEQPPAEYEFVFSGEQLEAMPNSSDKIDETGYGGADQYWIGWPVSGGFRTSGSISGQGQVTFGETTANGSLIHCYGMVGVGRGDNPDTGTGAELYTVIGHAPRHLDRNIALVGRVVEGIENLSSLPRGTGPLGFYEDPAQRVPIDSVRLASELSEAERPRFEVMRTDGDIFRRYVEARANRTGWFIRPAGAVDVCNVNLPIRRVVAED